MVPPFMHFPPLNRCPILQVSAIVGAVSTEFDSTHRELLQNDAGALYQKIVLEGSIDREDERIVDGAPEHDNFTFLLDLGLLALDPSRDVYLPVDPVIVQSRVVAPMGQRAADLLAESTGWATTFADLGLVFRRTAPSDVPIVELR